MNTPEARPTLSEDKLDIPIVALIGTSCVGKTTVIEAVKDLYPNDGQITVLEEQARNYFEAHPEITGYTEASVQGQLMGLILAAEDQAIIRQPKVIVSDRAPICAPVYTAAGGDSESAEALYRLQKPRLPMYRMLLLDTIGVPYKVDSVRQREGMDRQAVHEKYISFLGEHNVRYELVGGTLEDRINRVKTVIDENLA
jgi:nicotinamide riboside kinase